RKRVPELVSNAEAAFREVYYLPLSALGKMPTMDPKSKMLGVWTDGLRPVWADVPILFELWHEGLLPGMRSRLSDEEVPVDEHCHFKDGVMLFAPPNRKPVIVPSIYWGQVVHDEALGFIRFPHGGDAEAEFHF
ncbi:MAG: hypothetical protein IKS83_09820, partial [Victivallales bacterium]|nr:hypothetical protein [Victivallales bacterium]